MRQWVRLARVEEIEDPGDYLTFRIMGESVIVGAKLGRRAQYVRQRLSSPWGRGG